MNLVCSLTDCLELVTGSGVVLADDEPDSGIDWYNTDFRPYEGTEKPFVVLHPVCFQRVFEELIRQENVTVLSLIVGFAGDIKEALEI